jgi:hypothetical protein
MKSCLDIGDLRIKGDARGETDWWWVSVSPFPDHEDDSEFIEVANRLLTGEDLPPDFDTFTSDGLFDQEQLFAVFSAADVDALIERLRQARRDAFDR